MMQRKLFSRFCLSRYRHLLSAALDSEIDPTDRNAVERHLLECTRCTHQMEKLRLARNAIRSLEIPTPTVNYPGIDSLLRLADDSPGFNIQSAVSYTSQRHRRKTRVFAIATAGFALAVVIGVSLVVYRNMRRQPMKATAKTEVQDASPNSTTGTNAKSTPTPQDIHALSEGGGLKVATHRSTRAKLPAKTIAAQEIVLPDSLATTEVRGSDNDSAPTTPPRIIVRFRLKDTPLNIDLPENSKRGTYVVEVQTTGFRERATKRRSNRSDGRNLFISLPLQPVQPGNYILFIARTDFSGEHFIREVPITVEDPDPRNQDGTK